jgi:hypothetical protein
MLVFLHGSIQEKMVPELSALALYVSRTPADPRLRRLADILLLHDGL